MPTPLERRCAELLDELALVDPGETLDVRPLTGGVASDIARVGTAARTLCVKFALPRLRVAADWFAPVHRNAAEYAWLEIAARIAPEGAVTLHGRSGALHGFVMEYLYGEDVYLWKTALLDEAPDRGEAASVGDLLGRVHAASTASGFDVGPFENRDDFLALRVEPYLLHVATVHPDLAPTLTGMAERLLDARSVLVHGDVSPKNVFLRTRGPILLDAECATMGDASFDPAFCLSHLVLKAVHLPRSRERLLGSVLALWRAYRPSVVWEPVDAVESRVCELLPALMLARVDGKSPVEYLTDAERDTVRRTARRCLRSPVERLDDFVRAVDERLEPSKTD